MSVQPRVVCLIFQIIEMIMTAMRIIIISWRSSSYYSKVVFIMSVIMITRQWWCWQQCNSPQGFVHTVPYNDDSMVMMIMVRTKIMTTSRLFAYCSILTSKLSSTATIVWGLKAKAMMNTMMVIMIIMMTLSNMIMTISYSVNFLTACLSVKKSGRSRELLEQHLQIQV